MDLSNMLAKFRFVCKFWYSVCGVVY